METVKIILQFLNLLFIPAMYYIIKLERRLTKIETYCSLHMKGKILVDESEVE